MLGTMEQSGSIKADGLLNADLFTADDSDDDVMAVKKTSKVQRKPMQIDSDDDSDEERSLQIDEGVVETDKKSEKSEFLKDDEDNSSDKIEDTHQGEDAIDNVLGDQALDTSLAKLNTDLFDDEGDSSDEDRNENNESSESSDGECDDQPRKLNPKFLKKGGAAKTANSKSPGTSRQKSQRMTKSDLQDIHSESQRIVRESAVKIPYHQPKALSLQDFLNKRKQDKLGLTDLKNPSKGPLRKISPSKPAKQEVTMVANDTSAVDLPDLVVPRRKRMSAKEKVDNFLSSLPASTQTPEVEDCIDNGKEDLVGNLMENGQRNTGDTDKLCCEEVEKNVEIVYMDIKNTESTEVKEPEEIHNSKLEDARVDKADKQTNMTGEIKEGQSQDITLENEDTNDSQETEATCSQNMDMSQNQLSTSLVVKSSTLTPKLAGLELKSFTPKLSGDPDSFIDLDTEDTPKNYGIEKLKEQLIQHSTGRKHRHRRDHEISTVVKENVEEDKEELKIKKITIHIDSDEGEDDSLKKPGAKLMKLREKLKEGMAAKRQVARAERMQAYEMDNEEGFDDEPEDEDEAELTDQTDTDSEEEVMDEDEGPCMDDESYGDNKAQDKMVNPFVDDEADESGGDSADEQIDNDSDSNDESLPSLNFKTDTQPIDSNSEQTFRRPALEKSKTLDLFDDESESLDVTPALHIPQVITHSRDDTLENAQKTTLDNNESFKHDASFDLIRTFQPADYKKPGRFSELTLPIEDSQDIYNLNDESVNQGETTPTQIMPPESLHLSFDESQSQLLDSDGLLKATNPISHKVTKKHVDLQLSNSENATDFDELLGLCSGQFTEATQKSTNQQTGPFKPQESLFKSVIEGAVKTQSNMDELIGLCSGQFTEPQPVTQKPKKKKALVLDSDDEEDGPSVKHDDFEIVSDHEEADNDMGQFSDDDQKVGQRRRIKIVDNSDSENETGDIEHPSNESTEPKFKGFTVGQKQGKIRKDFIEEEAELSGSEYDSDENVDLDEKDDIMELEDGDFDESVANQEKLRDEVGRVHLRAVLNQDEREIRLMKELYLPDGDLHSDGPGRTRQFRWSNMDDDTQRDMFADDENEAANEGEGEEDSKWRTERFEREKWLQEQKNEDADIADDSQLIQLASKVIQKKGKRGFPDKKKDAPLPNLTTSPQLFTKFKNQKSGSFLKKDKTQLEKINETLKPISSVTGAKNSGNFVFTAMSPSSREEKKAKPLVRRANSLQGAPNAKKLKLDRSKSTFSSIFNHMVESQ